LISSKKKSHTGTEKRTLHRIFTLQELAEPTSAILT